MKCPEGYSIQARTKASEVVCTSPATHPTLQWEWGHAKQTFRETVTFHDAAFHSLFPALDILTNFLNSVPLVPQGDFIITLPSNFAVSKALDASPHEDQVATLNYLETLSELLTSFPEINIWLLWLPRSGPFVSFRRVRQLALKAIHITDLNTDEETHSIKDQKRRTKGVATISWAEQWHQELCTSLAYRTALMLPPNGKPHPTFLTRGEAAKFSCHTLCTMYRIITGHAFIVVLLQLQMMCSQKNSYNKCNKICKLMKIIT